MSGWGNDLREWYRYDASGYPSVNGTAQTTSNIGNRFMWTGREWLSAINAYDFRHRIYQPMIGRFVQKDPTGFAAGDMNLFRYCGGDPVNHTDAIGTVAEALGFFFAMENVAGQAMADAMNRRQQLNAQNAETPESRPTAKGDQQGSITLTGKNLRADTDGTGQSYGDPSHQNRASAIMNAKGQLVPVKDEEIGCNGNRHLNADTDRYVEVPARYLKTVHMGDRADVIARGQRRSYRVGDSGPPHPEVSVAGATSG